MGKPWIYSLNLKKQITGIEPASPAWEAGVLPMNYICVYPYYNTRRREIKRKIRKEKSTQGTGRFFLSYEGGDSDIQINYLHLL